MAISVAMMHFSWVRYHYKYTFEPREEELIESDLFNEPEYLANNLLSPYLQPVLERLCTKHGRMELLEPLYTLGETVFIRNKSVCLGLHFINDNIERFLYEPLDHTLYALMDISSP